jgi:hypothetical protein
LSEFLDNCNARLLCPSAAFLDPWQRPRGIQYSVANPTSESAAVVPDSVTRCLKSRTDRERRQRIQALGVDGIRLHQVHEQLHDRNVRLSNMKNDLNKTFCDFSMQSRDVHIDFPMLDALESLVEFPDYSSAMGHVVSRLRMDFLGFLRNVDDLLRY